MKILIIDQMHQSILPLLENIGCEGSYQPTISRQETLQIIDEYDGLIVRSKTPIDAGFLKIASHLKFVGRAGAGIDNVDMDAMEHYGIQLINAPEGNRDAVAEHTIGMILSLLHKISLADTQVRNLIWDREGNRGVELKNKTVGILGYGYMGKAVAERLTSFGCNILVFDLHNAKENEAKQSEEIRFVSFKEFIQKVELLSIHIPLNTLNFQLINKTYLQQFERLSYIVNTARGEVLSLSDLVQLLENDSIKGAALDVLENEKFETFSDKEKMLYTRLFEFNQVVLSPHVAGWTYESYEKINQVLVEKIKKIAQF